MPNLTSYHAPNIHLNRELPKTYCDLIEHEINYIHFLRTRIANIHSSLSFTNKKHLIYKNNIQQNQYFNYNQRLSIIHQHNLQLCKKLLQIWRNNSKQKYSIDCHNENYKKQINISHFRLRQKQWKDKIENENKQLIHSIIYHREKYRPIHDRYITQEAFEYHLKLLKTMSQYPKNNLTNSICKNLLNHNPLSKYIKFNKQKLQINEPIKHKRIKTDKYSCRSTTYIQTILQQAIKDTISTYNQPLPSAPNYTKSSYSKVDPWLKSRVNYQQEFLRSGLCHQLLESWRNKKQQRKPLKNYTIDDNMIDKNSHFLDSYTHIDKQKQIEIN